MAENIHIEGRQIAIKQVDDHDYISLTDMAKQRENAEPRFIIRNWMRNNNTILFIEAWEIQNNPNFNRAGMGTFKTLSLDNTFSPNPKNLKEMTAAIGIISTSGRYGGTYAHRDIAFEFATWLSPVFKLNLITEFQRLKSEEYQRHKLAWSETRFLSKINAGILSESVKENLLPRGHDKIRPFASAFDMVNLAVFDMTAKEWRAKYPELKGNIRDAASTLELILISNLESLNAVYIDAGASYEARLIRLYEVAKKQREILEADKRLNDDKKFLE